MRKATHSQDTGRSTACDYPHPLHEYEHLQSQVARNKGGLRGMIEGIIEKLAAGAVMSGLAGYIGIRIGVTRNENKIKGLEEKIENTERRLENTLAFIVEELKGIKADIHEFRRDVYKPRWSVDDG